MGMLENLNKVNNIPVLSVKDKRFKTYGKILEKYDFSKWISYMEKNTQIPKEGNVYYPAIEELESYYPFNEVQDGIYGGMDIQVGYCNGKNSTYNGFEYHKSSEINIAVTDFILVLGHIWDIEKNQYDVDNAELFLVEKGMAIEMYATTLHLSPCKVHDSGFKDIVILPKGTNTKLKEAKEAKEEEEKILLLKNKWILAHKDREPLVRQGAYIGIKGENKRVFY